MEFVRGGGGISFYLVVWLLLATTNVAQDCFGTGNECILEDGFSSPTITGNSKSVPNAESTWDGSGGSVKYYAEAFSTSSSSPPATYSDGTSTGQHAAIVGVGAGTIETISQDFTTPDCGGTDIVVTITYEHWNSVAASTGQQGSANEFPIQAGVKILDGTTEVAVFDVSGDMSSSEWIAESETITLEQGKTYTFQFYDESSSGQRESREEMQI
eukprot:TRINITY_DN10963_c0_g1_i3.p1 TRINITY_DN10963_c0_g1~~TRINITY_DN10963_c0_g1_i3.p1  ORF type:complete len:214 (-),score=17.35 TRINITY_DN10963_c0_g1_i3:90-731(-)